MRRRTCDQVREFLFECNAVFAKPVKFLHADEAQSTVYNLLPKS
jgi:hypothetical protein